MQFPNLNMFSTSRSASRAIQTPCGCHLAFTKMYCTNCHSARYVRLLCAAANYVLLPVAGHRGAAGAAVRMYSVTKDNRAPLLDHVNCLDQSPLGTRPMLPCPSVCSNGTQLSCAHACPGGSLQAQHINITCTGGTVVSRRGCSSRDE